LGDTIIPQVDDVTFILVKKGQGHTFYKKHLTSNFIWPDI